MFVVGWTVEVLLSSVDRYVLQVDSPDVKSLDALDLGDDFAVDARQHCVIVARLLVHDACVELVGQLLEVIPANRKTKQNYRRCLFGVEI